MKMKHIPILGLSLASSIAGCQQSEIPEGAYRVEKIDFVGESHPNAVIEANVGESLLEFVRFVHLVDRHGNRTIMVGEPTDGNTRAIYHGIINGCVEFLILDGSDKPYKRLLGESIVGFPKGKTQITLLKTQLIIEEVSEDYIRCRVISVRP